MLAPRCFHLLVARHAQRGDERPARLPRLDIVYKTVLANTPDFYALDMLGDILFSGPSSRMYQKLVKEKMLALQVAGGMDLRRGLRPCRDRAGLGQEGCAGLGENRLSRLLPIEDGDTELRLEIGDRVADGGCRASQSPAGCGETARFDNGQEYLELVEAGRSDMRPVRHF